MITKKRLIRLIKNYCKHLPVAIFAQLYFGLPQKQLKIIAVSGTDGKTTTANFIYHILKTAGKRVGIISTVYAKWPGGHLPTGLHVTNPDSWSLYRLIAQMTQDKVQYLVLEVTSHGIDQFRIFGIKPYIYILTNVTHEHIDYHHSFSQYLQTKLKPSRQASFTIFNIKDANLKKHLLRRPRTFSVTNDPKIKADLSIKLTRRNYQDQKALIKIETNTVNFKTLTPYPQPYNLTNLALAIKACLLLKIKTSHIQKAAASLPQITGRLEQIDTYGQNFLAYVDFAHTPFALEQVLTYLKKQKPTAASKLIAVFGSAGLRDKQKRPLLVKAAQQQADTIILTAEDPRTEDVTEIIKQMESGFSPTWQLADPDNLPKNLKKKYFIIPDRKDALDFAINSLVKDNDIVGFFGKGHEQSICYGKTELPWDEIKEVKKAILKKLYQNHIVGVVLAAGKGTRIQTLTKNKINKTMVPVLGKPMVGWAKDLLTASHIHNQIYVIGYKQKPIRQYLGDQTYVTQKKQLGTGDTLKHVLPVLNNKTRHVLVINADQAFYKPEILISLINHYLKGQYDAAVLSTLKDNPTGLGRIIRNQQGNLMNIIEERDASPKIKKIKEINTGTYIFNRKFLEKYLDQLPLHTDKNEYYLTDIFAVSLKNKKDPPKIGVLQINNPLVNLGFNTPEQLQQGEKILRKFYPEMSKV
ncbi:MAG: UDP-N-acetylmuramyl-tripeptide synthetase [bacterium]|nr:UDP-N-acetylmuramyl-tripeptide synthetase [bacterium]